jgi:hypothetical protein
MEWLAAQLGADRFKVQDPAFEDFREGDAVYRFFELFDLANVAAAEKIFGLAAEKKIRLTPPAKPVFEEKMLFALLWNRNLQEFWRQELGEGFLKQLKQLTPYTWLLDPAPLPPHAAIPELNLTDWRQLELLSQKERGLILKVSRAACFWAATCRRPTGARRWRRRCATLKPPRACCSVFTSPRWSRRPGMILIGTP